MYTPETNRVSRVHNVAAIVWLQFMVHVILFPIIVIIIIIIIIKAVMIFIIVFSVYNILISL